MRLWPTGSPASVCCDDSFAQRSPAMSEKTASIHWEGAGKTGQGQISTETGALNKHPYGFNSRFGDDRKGTNPEEIVGAAHAACFTMAFAFAAEAAGHPTQNIDTTAKVRLVKEGEGFAIDRIALTLTATVPASTKPPSRSWQPMPKPTARCPKRWRVCQRSRCRRRCAIDGHSAGRWGLQAPSPQRPAQRTSAKFWRTTRSGMRSHLTSRCTLAASCRTTHTTPP